MCRFYYCSPLVEFSEEDLAILYDSEYFGQATDRYEQMQRVIAPTRNLKRLESLSSRQIHDFLEIGFGQGYVLEKALTKGWRAVGVEVTPAYAESVRQRLGVPVLLGQLEELGLPSGSFDIIYANSVLEHTKDPETFLQECARILRPGGLGFFLVPNEDALINDFRHIVFRLLGRRTASRLDPFRDPYHLQGFSSHSLRMLFSRSGFKLVDLHISGGTGDIRKYKLRSWKHLALQLVLHPVYWIGEQIGRGISLVAVVTKDAS
jgi:SAM-dependent methyltransferase